MKAWQLQAFGRENLVLNDIPQPTPGPGEALIRISSVALNYRDKLLYDGNYNPHLEFPMTQVADAVGEIVALGPETSRFKTGDRVVTNYCTRWIDGPPTSKESLYTLGNVIPGALAEYLVLTEQALALAPSYLTNDEAAALPCAGLTAWYSLVEKGGLNAKQIVLLQGTGGVSLFGLQIAHAFGATTIVTSSSDEKLQRARALGATHTINYKTHPDWEKEALAITNKEGVDQILEVVGGPNLAHSIKAIRPEGQISIIGIIDGFDATIPLFGMIQKLGVLRGITVGPRRALEDMLRKFDELKLRPVIDSVYSFHDARKAFDRLEEGAFGKIVIRVRD
ncbi:NAD(P)-dependent alcohol dehydrogenase [Edaphobacter sp. 12200R-103]|uniref:zinc-dependent alcohol dehydrogenase family protein n=1 Tax=Edaphobacter sp. 12200R-103 TaxID=2703788 RepID=UPI00138BC509|nr:NAD(P)-dependent alcohol dehydrogenase [Edaphobacter sp. 12200R-103]QHS50660.1 NAD(P)-dependent alcohol dehydrogenase [Edaphobacter sp. 12200R-103]